MTGGRAGPRSTLSSTYVVPVRGLASSARCWPGTRTTRTTTISGRLTSENATQDRLNIRGYIDTARKHGQDVLTVIAQRHARRPAEPAGPRRRATLTRHRPR